MERKNFLWVSGDAWVSGKLKLALGYFFGLRYKKEEIKYIKLDDDYDIVCKGDIKLGEENTNPQTCICGEPTTLGVVHRKDKPCYVPDEPKPQETEYCTCKTPKIHEGQDNDGSFRICWNENCGKQIKPQEQLEEIDEMKYGMDKDAFSNQLRLDVNALIRNQQKLIKLARKE